MMPIPAVFFDDQTASWIRHVRFVEADQATMQKTARTNQRQGVY